MVIFPVIGGNGCPAYSDIQGEYITSFMPGRAIVWKINMCLNNTRSVALIELFDWTQKLLQMECLKGLIIRYWLSVFKPWYTIVHEKHIIGFQGVNNILVIHMLNLET
jgi:hypothetical protein